MIILSKKYEDILRNKTFYLYPNPESAKIKEISLSSTIHFIVRELISLEVIIKDMARSSICLHDHLLFENTAIYYQNNPNTTPIMKLLESLAPTGGRQIDLDYLYIIRLLLEGPKNVKMDTAQLKQWYSLSEEILTLLPLFNIPSHGVTVDLSACVDNSSRYINIPLSVFFSNKEPMSKNTFARLVTATTHFIILTYTSVARHCATVYIYVEEIVYDSLG